MLSKVIFNMAKRTVSFKFKDRLLANSIPVQALTTTEAKTAFDILNKSGDTLTVKELSLLFGKEETADAMVMENFLRKIIKDHNDQAEVSFDEFKMLVSKNEEFRGIQTAFENYDVDGKENITADDLIKWMNRHGKFLTKSQVDSIISGVDANGDEVIDIEEFLILVTKKLILDTVEETFKV